MRNLLFFFSLLLFGAMWSCGPKTASPSSYPIATKDYIWLDKSRIDSQYVGRRLMNARIWYPADTSNVARGLSSLKNTPYYFHIDEAWKDLPHWNESEVHFVDSIQTRSWEQLPVYMQSQKYPLILFSPSIGGNLSKYTFYAEELASRGYVVVGVNHLYESEYVFDPNFRLYPANFSYHDSLKELRIPDQITIDEYRLAKGVRQKVIAEDLLFCINELQGRQEEILSSMIDFDRIGLFGHSIGGSAAIYAAALDDRIDAVIDMDGSPPEQLINDGIKVPLMFIEDLTPYQTHSGYKIVQKRRNDFCSKTGSYAFRFLHADTDHNSFSDMSYHQAGTQEANIAAYKLLNEISANMGEFFDASLNGRKPAFQVQQSDSLEVFVFDKES